MTQATNLYGFDIVCRVDGSYAVYDLGWWPDEYLDADPELNEHWLEGTGGWRVKGWQVVHVAPSLTKARSWCSSVAKGK